MKIRVTKPTLSDQIRLGRRGFRFFGLCFVLLLTIPVNVNYQRYLGRASFDGRSLFFRDTVLLLL